MAEIQVHLRQTGPSTSEAQIRGHKLLVDRPVAKGGADLGPMGGEYFLASIGGCFLSTLLAAIRAREGDVTEVSAVVTGTLAESPSRFSAVELAVSATYSDPELFAKLLVIAENGCIMVNTLKRSLEFSVQSNVSVASTGL